ncbi:MAG: adenosylmethionine decarboxylase [Sciscionella sp.]
MGGTPGSAQAAVGSFTGAHVLAEIDGVPAAALDDVMSLRAALRSALEQAGATVCEIISRSFDPQGVTVLALLCESHASVHTYPERGSAFLDVFTCGHAADPELAVRLLAAALGAGSTQVTVVRRGGPLESVVDGEGR